MTTPHAATVVLHPRTRLTQAGTSETGWILEVPAGRRYRVGDDFARIALNLDGVTSPTDILDRAPGDRVWQVADVVTVTERLAELDALAVAGADADRPPSRLRRTSALVVQFDLWRPATVGRFARAVANVGWSRVGIAAQILLGIAGLVALAVGDPAVRAGAQGSMSLGEMLVMLAILWGSFVLHEFSHAGAVIRAGGRPRRFGVMLFYLMPAAYCDVTDVWLLPRAGRVMTLLAGILSQFALAGGLFLWGAAGGPAALTTVTGLLLLLTCSVNLIPFVKLDGYLLVAALTTTPFLHRRAGDAFTADVAHVVGGTPASREARWIRLFGIGTSLTPILLTVTVLGNLLVALSSWGVVGQLVVTALIGYVVGLLLKGAWRVLTAARPGPRARRGIPAALALGAFALTAAALAPVPATLTAAYVAPEDGAEPYLLYQSTDECLVPEPGAEVTLTTNSLVARAPRGTGVTDGAPTPTVASAFVTMPVLVDNPPQLPMLRQGLVADLPAGTTGAATVQRGTVPLAGQVLDTVWRCVL